jgi:hypothetical protein
MNFHNLRTRKAIYPKLMWRSLHVYLPFELEGATAMGNSGIKLPAGLFKKFLQIARMKSTVGRYCRREAGHLAPLGVCSSCYELPSAMLAS